MVTIDDKRGSRVGCLGVLLALALAGCSLEPVGVGGTEPGPAPDVMTDSSADQAELFDLVDVDVEGSVIIDFEDPAAYVVSGPGIVESGQAGLQSFDLAPADESIVTAAGIFAMDPLDGVPMSSTEPDLLGLWRLNEASYDGSNDEVEDSSGNGWSGQTSGVVGAPPAKFGGGLWSEPTGFVEVGDDDALETVPDTSLAVWFKEPSTGFATGSLLGKRATVPALNANRMLLHDAGMPMGLERGFQGGVFDGQYMYFAPRGDDAAPHGEVLRYDTRSDYSDPMAWERFSSELSFGATAYAGAAFDGQYVYFVPLADSGGPSTRVMRYNTQAAFTLPTSWQVFDLGSRVPGAEGFYGSTFDGRYLYLSPFTGHSNVVRFDTEGSFTNPVSWSAFDMTQVNAAAEGYAGAIFDGRYLFFAPLGIDPAAHGLVVRYDTQGPLDNVGSWETYDTTVFLGADAQGFANLISDGRFLYFVPFHNGTGGHNKVVRYELAQPFDADTSWSAYNIQPGLNWYVDAAYDGQYVYYLRSDPNRVQGDDILRYDTNGAFDTGASYSRLDLDSGGGAGSNGYSSLLFDGRYLYAVPEHDGTGFHSRVLRIDPQTQNNGLTLWRSLGAQSGTSSGPRGPAVSLDTDTGHYVAASAAMPSGDLFHHAVGTWDGTQLEVFVDGVSLAQTPTMGTADVNNADVRFGHGFHGVLDEVAWFSTTLDAARVSALHLRGRARDSSARANHGDLRADVQDLASFSNEFGGALQFSVGGHATVDSEDDVWLPASGFTIVSWVQRASSRVAALPEYVVNQWFPRAEMTANRFESFDGSLTGVTGGFSGAVFDGAYVYLVPEDDGAPHGRLVRYAPGDMMNPTSWEVFDLGDAMGLDARGFSGAAFDGRYLYLAPSGADSTSIVRFDTRADFAALASYESFDLAQELSLDPVVIGYLGGLFDGRYVYFAPGEAPDAHSQMLRFDTTGDFASAGSWLTADVSALAGNDLSGTGSIGYDGDYLYLAPGQAPNGTRGMFGRYRLSDTITSDSSWESFDVSGVDANALSFAGSAFDGRFMYFVPSADAQPASTTLVLYDTTMMFADAAAWLTFDMGSLGANLGGYRGAVFDGRYLYLVPFSNTTANHHGLVTRYDTQAAVDDPLAWLTLDVGITGGLVTVGFVGALFDGHYIHFVPNEDDSGKHARVLRYDALSDDSAFVLGTGLGNQSGGLSAGPPGPFVRARTTSGSLFSSAPVALDGMWHELSARASGVEATIFVDGIRHSAVPGTNDSFVPGHGRMNIGERFSGTLDDIGIYPSFLNDAFVLRHAVNGYPASNRGVVTTSMSLAVEPDVPLTVFLANEDRPPGTEIGYQLSVDGGTTWLYFDGGWVSSGNSIALNSDAMTVSEQIGDLPLGDGTIGLRVVLLTTDSGIAPSVQEVLIGWN